MQYSLDGEAAVIAFTLTGVGWRPFGVIRWPRYSTSGRKNIHLLCLSRNPAASKLDSTDSKLSKWALSDDPETNMSSKYTLTFGIPFNKLSITRWKIAGAADAPNGNLVNLNSPYVCVWSYSPLTRGVARGGLGRHLPLHHLSSPPINFKCLITLNTIP